MREMSVPVCQCVEHGERHFHFTPFKPRHGTSTPRRHDGDTTTSCRSNKSTRRRHHVKTTTTPRKFSLTVKNFAVSRYESFCKSGGRLSACRRRAGMVSIGGCAKGDRRVPACQCVFITRDKIGVVTRRTVVTWWPVPVPQ